MTLIHIAIAVAALSAPQTAPGAPSPVCREWHECQRLALDAYASGDYERFHDLAWRTVQTGPARNPELMYLLARAQSLSGRPHDALVMLGRLVEMGFATDAATNDDFRAVRQLRQWQELEASATGGARTVGATAPAVPPANVSPAAAAPPAAASPPATATTPSVAAPSANVPATAAAVPRLEEALRIPGSVPGPAGLAYDRVSSRFVMADAGLHKLLIIDERSRHVVDLVTSASAGFYDITGLEIDPARGDLWVVSAEPDSPAADGSAASALHKLQLVSGRPIDRIPVPGDLQPCRLADVAVTSDGRVLVLDSAGKRLLRFRPGDHSFMRIAALPLESPASLAPAGDRVVYVAHAAGIARVDLTTGAVESLASARDADLSGFERIRWARNSLVGVQHLADGSTRAVRVKVGAGRAAIEVLDDLSATERAVGAVSGDEFYFLVHHPAGDAGELVIRRTRLP